MGWFSRLFSKEIPTQPIAKVRSSTPVLDNEIRTKKETQYHTIVRDFQGKFIKGNPYNMPRDTKTGRFMKK